VTRRVRKSLAEMVEESPELELEVPLVPEA
jgi:hypothetical protein